MDNLKTKAIEKLARQLTNLGCEYMIVPGEGKPLTKGKFTHHVGIKHGEYAKYICTFVDTLQPGESVEIPIGNYPAAALHASASSRCFAAFGKGNFMTSRNDEREVIEVLCLDREEPEVEDGDA